MPEEFPPLFIDLIKARWWIPLQLQAAYLNSRKTVRLRQAILYFNGMGEAETYLDIIRKSLQPCVDEGLNLHLGADEEEGEDPIHVMPFTNDIGHWHEDLIDRGAIRFGRCDTWGLRPNFYHPSTIQYLLVATFAGVATCTQQVPSDDYLSFLVPIVHSACDIQCHD